MSDAAIEVLLAEDNPGDVRLTRDALRQGSIRMNLSVVGDGAEAMAFLRREGNYARAARPSLILLDLNMPRMDGREVLVEIKKDPNLACIPVVVFTSSEVDEDVVQSYRLHASGFVSKPTFVDQYTSAVKSIEDFWLRVAKLPPHCSARK
jgi:two-component system, chemotaxis family, response regulator Rcp1